MTPFELYFYPIFGTGLIIALFASIAAGKTSRILLAVVFMLIGIGSFWGSLFIGSEVGYQMWQSMPNPPDVAFNDTMPMGALIAGWVPACIFCGFIFGATKAFCLLFNSRLKSNEQAIVSAIETGNPYQTPQQLDENNQRATR